MFPFGGKKVGVFGPAVIGEERVEVEKALVVDRRQKFGPAVVGDNVKEDTATPLPDSNYVDPGGNDPVKSLTISVADMTAMLEKNVAYLDHYIAMEKARVGGPRRSALKVLLRYEAADKKRQFVLDDLKRLMADKDKELPKVDALPGREDEE